jgi:hypothetical protein
MLLIGCDGGVYRRTTPGSNVGDWFSAIGDLETTEFHSVAWDANTHTVVGGAQDTGSPDQLLAKAVTWQSVSTGDGGVVAVDAVSTPGLSSRYSSFDSFSEFRREVYDAANVLQSQFLPKLTVINNGDPLSAQFYTPFKLNSVVPTRLVIGASNAVYESLDQGDTINEIGPGIKVNANGGNAIAYGAAGNEDILYVGAGSRVFVRDAADPAPLVRSAAYAGAMVLGIAIDPGNPKTAFVVDPSDVFQTTDAGGHWTPITGDLNSLHPGPLHSVAYSADPAGAALLVGGTTGAFRAPGAAFNKWGRLGNALPNAPVYYIEYDGRDRIILAGTLGRGAWKLDLAAPTGGPARTAPAAPGGR